MSQSRAVDMIAARADEPRRSPSLDRVSGVKTPLASVRPMHTDGPDTADGSRAEFARRVWTTVGIVVASALIAAGVWAGRSALLLIYVSLLAATGLLPLVARLERLAAQPNAEVGVPRWIFIAVVYASFLAVVIAIGRAIFPPLYSQIVDLRVTLPSLFDTWQGWLLRHGWLSHRMTLADAMHQSAPAVDVTQPIALATSAARRLAGGIAGLVTVLILTFYILLDGPHLTTELARAVPLRHRARFTAVVRDVTGRVSAWLQGNLILASIMGGVTAITMGLLGEPFYYVVALLAAIGEFVPLAGPLLAGAFAVLLALTVSVKLALWVGLVFLLLHELDTNLLIPRIMGRQVGLSSLAVFVAVLLGAEWFGLTGAILAIPTTAIVSAVVEELRSPRVDRPPAD
jgi:predicted PurR-regulated permease PerM